MAFCLSDGLMQVDYDDDEEEFVYSEEEEEYCDSAQPPLGATLMQAQKQADSAAYEEGDDYFLDDDEDEQPTSAIQLERKPWEVDFKAHDLEALQGRQEEMVTDLEPLLAVSRSSTDLLLRSYQWKTETLVEDYLADPDKVLSKTGVHAHPPVPSIESGDEEFACEICYGSGADEQYMGLVCGHRFCTSCYETYLTIKITEGDSWLIPCPAPKCKTLLGEEPTRLILTGNKEMLAKYESNLARSFVKSATTLAWCPAPSCEYAIECLVPRSGMDTTIPIVHCKCGKSFCFGCKVDNHIPAPCSLVKRWQKKCEDDSETSHWIKANTKDCPKCNTVIEKNRGCNHMTCRECHHHFCWVCMGPWSEHGQAYYACNKYNEATEGVNTSVSDARAQLERYMHYFTRYNNHEQSAKFAQNLLEATEANMEQLQRDMSLSWIDVVFLKNAVDVLTDCRAALKWTYVLGYYMVSDNQKVLFENNQSDLEMATEQLTELVEDPGDSSGIEDIKRKVLDMSHYVKSRLDILVTDTYQGLQENRWRFED
ncbi:hypothetical protein IWW57_002017 [Coemansia sp. S610]|uniref:Uncharacterized protein n=1 Tax=Coemansia linderi TaxID=2663919 RepID=A0ACC1KMH8_9FUNG|nr:hypothetical protein LPJ60_000060 [Coemansia sp. RSA 2675]KAJ2028744.1 hypothetical protein IWW57_002017 [Coemansia sp. S610]KAJ2792021.1 hypothetical protein GGI18_000711 [Coemansia linderi]